MIGVYYLKRAEIYILITAMHISTEMVISFGLLTIAYILLWVPVRQFYYKTCNLASLLVFLAALFYATLFNQVGFSGLGFVLLFLSLCFVAF
jgi:hypothetical protein